MWGLVVFGLYVVVRGWVPPASVWNRRAMRLELLALALYVSLFLVEVIVAVFAIGGVRYTPKPALLSLQGLYVTDSAAGYRHAPNFDGAFDDGLRRVPFRTNSLGDRDDEPGSADERATRVLLIGDSFAFGFGLARQESIEQRLESLGQGSLDVYNQSAIAYNTANVLARLESTEWWTGTAIVYALFNNDLADHGLNHYRVVDGLLVNRYDDAGRPISHDAARKRIALARAWYPWTDRVKRVVFLKTVRETIAGLLRIEELDEWPRDGRRGDDRGCGAEDIPHARGGERTRREIPRRRHPDAVGGVGRALLREHREFRRGATRPGNRADRDARASRRGRLLRRGPTFHRERRREGRRGDLRAHARPISYFPELGVSSPQTTPGRVMRRPIRQFPLLALSIGSLCLPAFATEDVDPLEIHKQEQVDVRLVLIDTVVIDRQGRTVSDLTIDEFVVTVDGRRRPIDTLDVRCPIGAAADATVGPDTRISARGRTGRRVERDIVLTFDYLHMNRAAAYRGAGPRAGDGRARHGRPATG